jgi:glycosyltransferase involved in cell wall biosynthesis
MNFCILIPCYNHPATVDAVARAAQKHAPVIIVDDGSSSPLPEFSGCEMIRLAQNSGKGAALRAGFKFADENNFTHAIVMDADGQHFAEDLPKFFDAAQSQPTALVVGVRDFFAAGCPTHRRRSNVISSFWFRVETGVPLGDTQCGFRCYPLALTKNLKTKSERYAFELEFMVRAVWVGTPIVAVPVKCSYEPHQLRQSHFRPVKDFLHITTMNVGLVLQSWFVPRPLRAAWSLGKKVSLRKTFYEFFSEHAHDPLRMSLAVGLGLFCGIAPVWGFQMALAAAVAHWLRLNKAIALVASNISLPPVAFLITAVSILLGHWIFTGQRLPFPPPIDFSKTGEYLGQWIIGSFALASVAAVVGIFATYFVARIFLKKRSS